MRGGMPEYLLSFGILEREHLELAAFFDRPAHIENLAINLARERGLRQPGADALRHLSSGDAFLEVVRGAVGIDELYLVNCAGKIGRVFIGYCQFASHISFQNWSYDFAAGSL